MQVPKRESDYSDDPARLLSQAASSGQHMIARLERKGKILTSVQLVQVPKLEAD